MSACWNGSVGSSRKRTLGFRRDRPGDLDDVLLRQRQVADPGVQRHGVLFGSHGRQQPLRFRPAGRARSAMAPQAGVLQDRHFLGQLGMLEGHGHAGAMQLLGVGSLDLLAGDANDREVGPHGARRRCR